MAFTTIRQRIHQVITRPSVSLEELVVAAGWSVDAWISAHDEALGFEDPEGFQQEPELLDLLTALRARALSYVEEHRSPETAELLEKMLEELEARRQTMSHATFQSFHEEFAGLLMLEERSYTLHLLFMALEGDRRDWVLADAKRVCSWLTRETKNAAKRLEKESPSLAGARGAQNQSTSLLDLLSVEQTTKKLFEIRVSMARAQQKLACSRAEQLLSSEGDESLPEVADLLFDSSMIRGEIDALVLQKKLGDATTWEGTGPEETPRLIPIEQKLRSSIEGELRQPDRAIAPAVEELAHGLLEHGHEIYTTATDRPNPEGIPILKCFLELTDWMLGAIDRSAPVNRPKRRSIRQLKQQRRRVMDELLEQQLEARLVRRFGKRWVRVTESLVFFFIFVLVGLLAVDMSVELDPDLRNKLDLVDGIICLFLLIEIGVRTVYSPQPLRYIRRHFFVDFLPSIPIGLLTWGLGTGDALHLEWVRLFRLPRLVRYVRIARPLLRSVRLLIFLLRGMDQVVHRFRSILQSNLLLFDFRTRGTETASDPLRRLPRLRTRNLQRLRLLVPEISFPKLVALLDLASEAVACRPELSLSGASPLQSASKGGSRFPVVHADDLIDSLKHLNGAEVELFLGPGLTQRLATVLKYMNLPGFRSLPLVRTFAGASDEASSETIASAGRRLGDVLEKLLSLVYWFADLQGVISGPALLDKVGNTLVTSSQRPAKRLILFGGIFLLVKIVLDVLFLHFKVLESVAKSLTSTLGVGFVVVGAICLIFMGTGIWLRRLASDATDVYHNVVEAQYTNLLETLKENKRKRDCQILACRVLEPEKVLRGTFPADPGLFQRQELPQVSPDDHRAFRARCDTKRILLLYRDFLDGSVLHSTDTKTAEQLLGNLVLMNIRLERLNYTKAELKRLERLELSRRKSVLGPHIWFHLLTSSVAEQTAKLILEFNRYCIPLRELDRASSEELAAMSNWLDRMSGRATGRLRRDVDKERRQFHRLVSTSFNALHFLSVDEELDLEVQYEFGDEVLEALSVARRTMIRRIFGSYPLERLPKRVRTINLYNIYRTRLWGGRVVLLPFYIIGILLRSLPWLIRLLATSVRDILNPEFLPESVELPTSSIESVRRKLDRMRRPIFFEAMRLRAEFDPEYLGLALPGLPPPPRSFSVYAEDLGFVRAENREKEELEKLREKRRMAVARLARVLVELGYLEQTKEKGLHLSAGVSAEGIRAIGIAWCINYKSIAELFQIEGRIDKSLQEIARNRRWLLEIHPARFLTTLLKRMLKTFLFLRADRESRAISSYLAVRFPAGLSRLQAFPYRLAYHLDYQGLGKGIRKLVDQGISTQATERGAGLIRQIYSHPESWSTQLLTIRTVQALSVLDLIHVRETVEALGSFEEASAPGPLPVSVSAKKNKPSSGKS